MSQSNTEFREDLAYNSYFVDGVYNKIREEVEFAAEQFEQANGTQISDGEIESIVEDIVDDGLNALTENNGNN